MKKVYKKPTVVFEDFSLSANIAACVGIDLHALGVCGQTATHSDENSCIFYDFGGAEAIFLSAENGCGTVPQDGGICYDVPTDSVRLFGS